MTPMLGIMASQISGHLYTLTGNYDSIQTVTVGTAQSSVTFTSIPNNYTHLEIRIFAKEVTGGSPPYNFQMQFNSDTTAANYSTHSLLGTGAAASASGTANSGFCEIGYIGGTYFNANIVSVLDYASTVKYKTSKALGGYDQNGSGRILLSSGAWFNSATAISSITFSSSTGNIDQYSSFALYGIK